MSKFNRVNDFVTTLVIPVVVINCLSIGFLIKTSLTFIPNDKIPLIVVVAGIFYNSWINNWTLTPKVFIEGVVSGLASTGSFELIRNLGIKI